MSTLIATFRSCGSTERYASFEIQLPAFRYPSSVTNLIIKDAYILRFYRLADTTCRMIRYHELIGVSGLGSMGYPMCMNIHKKINADDHLFICDINQAQLENFVQEKSGQAEVGILKTPRDICESCVSNAGRYSPVAVRLGLFTLRCVCVGHHHNYASEKRTRAASLPCRRE